MPEKSFQPGEPVVFVDANNVARVGVVVEQFTENEICRVKIKTARGMISPHAERVGRPDREEFTPTGYAFPPIAL